MEKKCFKGLLEKFLSQRNINISPYLPVTCSVGHLQERTTVIKRIREGKEFIFCEECGKKINLLKVEKPLDLGETDTGKIRKRWICCDITKFVRNASCSNKRVLDEIELPLDVILVTYQTMKNGVKEIKTDLRDAWDFSH